MQKRSNRMFSDGDRIILGKKKISIDPEKEKQQTKIQNELCEELPQLEDIIKSELVLASLKWKTLDYLDLTYGHYKLIIQKIKDYLRDL